MKRYLLSLGFFKGAYIFVVFLCLVLFLLTSYLVVAAQSCMLPIRKSKAIYFYLKYLCQCPNCSYLSNHVVKQGSKTSFQVLSKS